MPIYEYNCHDCHERVPLFFRTFAEVETRPVICPHCEGSHLERVISRVAVMNVPRGGQAGQTSGAVSGASAPDQSDPKVLARSMHEAGQGKDFGGEFKEVAGRLAGGEQPASVEKSLRQRVGQKPDIH